MSTDEYKTFFVHYNHNQNNHYCLGPTTTTTPTPSNFYKNNNIFYETVFEQANNNKQKSDKNSLNSSITTTTTTTTNQKSLTFQPTDDVNNNNNFKPMNLITNTGLDLSHSIRKPTTYNNNNHNHNHHSNNHSHSLSNCVTSTTTTTTTGNYYENASLNLLSNNYPNITYALSPASSSSSSSIDVENDYDKDNRETCLSEPILMSPVSIPTPHQQKPLLADTRNTSQSAFSSAMELTAGAIPSPFSLSYQQLYANNTALYGAPVMFSGAIHAAHASYMTGLPLHAALSPNETYLKAIQAAACGIYSPTALTAAPAAPQAVVIPPHTAASSSSSSSLNCKSSPTLSASASTLHNSCVTNVINLAPATPPSPVAHTKSSPHHLYSTNIMSNCPSNGNSNLKHELTKKDYHASAMQSQTRLSATNNCNNGTYLNDKVNERLSSVDAAKDSHFKVPNGKEGSLKHRILRPASNVDTAAEANKTPIMRTYSSTSNFRKGNYIELANGTLRRVEDMRTEDFIQCAERSPHHQLAESTVVKINTSLPTMAVITFSYDRNRSKIDMEVSLDHPFFVYGQGWASCHPEMSLKMFGLKCQRLQVGDICISLTKREQIRQHVPPLTALAPTTVLPTHVNEVVNYQRKPLITVSSPNANTNDMPTYAHAFTMPVVQPTASHHLHQQQQAYAEMAKLMSSYAYAKALPQIPHEQLKDVVMDAPKMMSAFYQNQIFQFAQQQQQQQQQEHLRHRASAMSLGHYSASSHSPTQPTDLEQQPPQTQPLDVTMSRKRRWSAPENMFDDEDSETQPPRNGSSPATARL